MSPDEEKTTEQAPSISERLLAYLFSYLIVGLATTGSVFVLSQVLSLPVDVPDILLRLIPFFIFSFFIYFFLKNRFLLMLPLFLALGICIFNISSVVTGIQQISAAFSSILTMGSVSEEAVLSMSAPASADAISMVLHVIFLFFLSISGFSVAAKNSASGLLICEFPFFLLVLLNAGSVTIWALLCILTACICMFIFTINKNIATQSDHGKGFRNTDKLLELRPHSVAFFALPIILAAVMLLFLFLPSQKDYTETVAEKRFRQTMQQTMFFDALTPWNDELDNGNLRNVDELVYSGQNALRIRTDHTQGYLYLTGYAGTEYTRNGWKDASASEFALLEKQMNGIDPRNLTSLFLLFHRDEKPETISVSREYTDGSKLFLPNGLLTNLSDIPYAKATNDTSVKTAFLHKIWEYSVEAYPESHHIQSKILIPGNDRNSILNAYKDVSAATLSDVSGYLDLNGKRVKASDFREAASAYTDYVTEVYTRLPDDVMKNAKALCKTFGLRIDNSLLDISALVTKVRKVLTSNVDYSADPENISLSSDFTSALLLSTKEGSYKHFATAAAVLLRSMNIPVRYAEGYIVLPSDLEQEADADGYIALPDNHARAWIELYDPYTFNWIPFDLSFTDGDAGSGTEQEESEGEPLEDSTDSDSQEDDAGESEEDSGEEQEPSGTPEPESGNNDNPPEETPNPRQNDTGNDSPEEDTSEPDETESEEPDTGDDSAPGDPSEDGDEEDGLPSGFDMNGDENSGNDISSGEGAGGSSHVPLWPFLLAGLLALLAAGHFLPFLIRKKKLGNGSPKESIRFACRYCLRICFRLTKESYLPSDAPSDYLGRIRKECPVLSTDALAKLLQKTEAVRFNSEKASEEDRQNAAKAAALTFHKGMSALKWYRKIFFWYTYRI